MLMFSKHVGIKDSKEAEVLVNFYLLRIFSILFQEELNVEIDSSNANCGDIQYIEAMEIASVQGN